MTARLLSWLVLAWTLTVAVRYLSTVQKSLNNPFNPGDEFTWLKIGLGFIAVAAVALRINRIVAFRMLSLLLAGLAGAMVILSGSVIPFLIAIWVAAVAVILGDLLLVWLGLQPPESLCDWFVIALPLGLSCLALLSLVLAFLGLFTVQAIWASFGFITVASGKHAVKLVSIFKQRYTASRVGPSIVFEFPLLFLLAEFMFVMNFAWSVAPEIQFDTLSMRLAVPQIFLKKGGFVDLGFFHSYLVHLVEFLYGFCMGLHGEAVAKFLNAIISVAAAVSVYSLGRLLCSRAIGFWAAVFFYTTPLSGWIAGTAYTDLAVTEFVTACLIAFLLWYQSRNSNWLRVSGLLAGAAVAIKLNAAFAVLGTAIVLMWILLRSSDTWINKLRDLDAFVTLSALAAFPWYLVTLVLTGNPIFPLLNAVFRSPKSDLTNTVFNSGNFGVGTSLSALLRLPFRLTFDTTRFGEGLPRGALGLMLLFFIPFGILWVRRKGAEARGVAFVTAFYLALWAFSFQYGRYYLAVLPGITVLGLAGIQSALPPSFSKRFFSVVLGVLLVAQMAVLPLLFWSIPERFPTDLAFGWEEREPFLHRTLIGYGAAQYLNGAVKPGDRILAIDFEYLRFYLNAPMESLAESLLDSDLRPVTGLAPGPELARVLSQLHYSHLLTSPDSLKNPPTYYPYTYPEFIRDFAVLEYSGEAVRVYRFKH